MSERNPADGVAARNAARHTERTIRMIEQTPAQFRDDVQAWVTALGGRGRRKSRPLTEVTIALYLNFAQPVLHEWAETHQSLRSVETVDIERALSRHSGQSRHNVHTALRSLFRGLKRERRIFADPAREVAGRYTRRILRPLGSDRVHGLFDQLTRPDDRVILALVAVHALTIEEVIGFRLDHLDRSAGRATVTRPHTRHTFWLDEFTAEVLRDWLIYRQLRWPTSTNPYLLITRITAPTALPGSRHYITRPFRDLGITARELRVDRILDEAAHSGDPVALMTVFGIGTTTAVRYVRTAHPGRFDVDPTAP
ncbi:integrase [Rhodococcus sp. 5A-K4]|uniref:integrase n=1 Tax=Rhodococcus TaxID=1827 RepID=UPI00355B1E44